MPRSYQERLPNRTTTIKDVARKARVSASTVSRVMSGSRRVDPAIAQHVKRVAESLQYHPNRLAHSLRKTSSFAVGLLVLDITNPFCAQIARSAQQVLDAAGYLTILCDGERNPERELRYLATLLEARVAGLIINSSADDPTNFEKYCERHHLPGILVDRHRSSILDSVRVDNYSGTLQAIAHLASRGYRRIAIIAGQQSALSGYERVDAYRRAIRMYNLEDDESLVQVGDFTETSGYNLSQKLLKLSTPPQAIFAGNNTIGFGVFRALRDQGVRIPEEMALLIFDDFVLADLTAPPLTVIAQPLAEIGQTAAQLLLRRLGGQDQLEVQELLLQPKLILRGSV
jgi:LacI family transcriptional regulator